MSLGTHSSPVSIRHFKHSVREGLYLVGRWLTHLVWSRPPVPGHPAATCLSCLRAASPCSPLTSRGRNIWRRIISASHSSAWFLFRSVAKERQQTRVNTVCRQHTWTEISGSNILNVLYAMPQCSIWGIARDIWINIVFAAYQKPKLNRQKVKVWQDFCHSLCLHPEEFVK